MPFTSAQVSGLVGGQQAMFANDRSFAEQIAGMPSLPQQNPYPTYSNPPHAFEHQGAAIAGGVGMAIPGVAAAGTMAASLLGYNSALGLLDPFTGISRGFGAGASGLGATGRAGIMAGQQGMGIMAGLRGIGSAFSQGGVRAGLGALGGGLAGAAVAAVPYYLAGKAISFAGENIFQGAQNIQDVGRMTQQYFNPQFERGRTGGKPGLGMIRQVTDVLQSLASDDTMRSMEDMRRLMDRAGQMGMLEGVSDARQFKDKFTKILKSAKAVAQVLGSSVEEAMPFVNQMNRMGMWTASDVMGTAAEARALGPQGAQAMMGAMQTGAQMSHAMGGRMAAGAQTARDLFTQVAAGRRMGTFSERDIMEYTGGVGGAQGQQMMAGSLQQVMAGMGRTALGRLMMAGLGEIEGEGKERRFTGRMDEGLMARFKSGDISVAELQRLGQGRIQGNQNLAASFFNREGQLSQAMGAEGGLEALDAGLKQALRRAGRSDAGSEIKNRFIQLLTGANQRQADVLQRMLNDLPRIRDERERKIYAALEDSFREGDIRRNRSWTGFKEAVGQAFEDVGRPFQEFGQNLATGMSEFGERVGSWISGRARQMPRVTEQEMMQMRLRGGLANAPSLQELGITNVGQGFVDPGAFANATMRLRQEGAGRRVFGGMAMGAAGGALIGSAVPILGTTGGAIAGGIAGGIAGLAGYDPLAAMRGGMEAGGLNLTGTEAAQLLPRARTFLEAGLQARRGTARAHEVELGGGIVATSQDLQLTARRALMRSRGATLSGLLGDDEEKRTAMNVINTRMRKVLTDPSKSDELARLKEDRPDEYARKLMSEVTDSADARMAMRTLTKDHPMGAGSEGAALDVAAVSLKETGTQGGEFGVDFDRVAEDLAGIAVGTPEELEERQRELADEMSSSSGAFGGALAAAAAGATVGAVGGAAFFGVGALIGGAIGGVIGGTVGLLGHWGTKSMSSDDFVQALTSDKYTAQDVIKYIEGEGDTPFAMAAAQGDPAAQKLREYIRSGQVSKETLKEQVGQFGKLRAGQGYAQEQSRLKRIAGRVGPIGDIKGVRAETESELEKARKAFESGSVQEGFGILGGMDLTEVETQKLRTGENVLGRQAALMKDIAGMGAMDAGKFEKFRQKLTQGAGGVDLFSSIQASLQGEERVKFEQMLKGGITEEELSEKLTIGGEQQTLKEVLSRASTSAMGRGGRKGQDQFMEMMTKYTEANERFVWAVSKSLGDELHQPAEDVKQTNPVKA